MVDVRISLTVMPGYFAAIDATAAMLRIERREPTEAEMQALVDLCIEEGAIKLVIE
jgi:hypothetical protein